ncbi:flagellar export protein FliJ [Arthrobacter livingstonensis]|uniref:Flagellar FliJ protein n=1 Tax=Arthrobacter livingstonensis TaxID=670078 RepID=A0A2V5L645_9MICC|nr:flagellar export protein FliJ [Arthrobacter livingstonensis]PYI66859.1 flagellar export protein FliJ [Arthrobacter livingstonensis]
MTKTFRLAGLLRLRKLQEDQASASLARANDNRKSHARRLASARGELADSASDAGSAAALSAAAAARAASRSLLLELRSLATTLEAEADSAQAVLLEAKTAASSLEKLEERHQLDSVSAELLAEQGFLDELALSRRKGAE